MISRPDPPGPSRRRSFRLVGAAALAAAVALSGCATQSMPSRTTAATATPETPTTVEERARGSNRAITHGPRDRPLVAITLDADFSPYALERVKDGRYGRQVDDAAINLLTKRQVPATVFVTGMWARQYPDAFARLAADPRIEIANHTWSHRAWTARCYGLPRVSSEAAKRREVERTNDLIRARTGSNPKWFRFPGLCHDTADVRLVAKAGLRSVDTDVPASDAFATDARRTARAMLASVRPGSILLFHLNGPPNAPATARILRILLTGLRERGLEPVTLSRLLGR